MKFNYKKFVTSNGAVLRPVIPVKLKSASESFDYEVLVDSGADICIFHSEIGELLGINVPKGKPREVFGVGVKASIYYLHKITIEVGRWSYNVEVGFMPSVSGHAMRHGIVGQKGFFDNFIVKFDLLKEEIELKLRK